MRSRCAAILAAALATLAATASAASSAKAEDAGYFRVVPSELGPMPAGRTHEDWPWEPVHLPQVTGGAPGVAERINAQLALTFLDTPPPVAPGAALPTPQDVIVGGLEFDIARNDARLLSIRITTAGCGAHCEWFTHIVHFDPRTGRQVRLSDLLLPPAMARARTALAQVGVALYANGLARLPRPSEPEPDAAEADPDADDTAAPDDGLVQPQPPADTEPIDLTDDADGSEHRFIFEYCQRSWQDELDAADRSSDEPDFELAADGTMTLPLQACRHDPRGMHLEDQLFWSSQVVVVLRPQSLARLATPFGRALILRSAVVPAFEDVRNQVVRGHVGTARITLKLRNDRDGSCSAIYFYERYRQSIDLAGTCTASNWTFREDGGVFEMHPDHGGLIGMWRGKGRTLPARLD